MFLHINRRATKFAGIDWPCATLLQGSLKKADRWVFMENGCQSYPDSQQWLLQHQVWALLYWEG